MSDRATWATRRNRRTPSCLVPHGAEIVILKGTADLHFEAEFVGVIGKGGKDIPVADAMKHVFGVTAGNDTFGPVGPFLLTGADYGDRDVHLRLNGQVLQRQRTKDLIHDIPRTVAFVSAHVTLEPATSSSPARAARLPP